MKWIIFLVITCGIIFTAAQTNVKRDAIIGENPEGLIDTIFNQQEAIKAILAEIEGREDQPAGEVFKNLEIFADMPAGRLVRIMEIGYGRSLGVDCTHCHNPLAWESDEKDAKNIAREMQDMVMKINFELLAEISYFKGRNPPAIVNCTTCHRGEVKPRHNMN
jgi:hypothetical protein